MEVEKTTHNSFQASHEGHTSGQEYIMKHMEVEKTTTTVSTLLRFLFFPTIHKWHIKQGMFAKNTIQKSRIHHKTEKPWKPDLHVTKLQKYNHSTRKVDSTLEQSHSHMIYRLPATC